MTKHERLLALKQIIASADARTQEALSAELRKRGARVTQATLSRDLAELGAERVRAERGLKYALPPAASQQMMRNLAGFEIVNVEANESVVIVRTLAGHAHAVGAYLDSVKNKNILGTLAGDDTILVVPACAAKTKTVKRFVQEILA